MKIENTNDLGHNIARDCENARIVNVTNARKKFALMVNGEEKFIIMRHGMPLKMLIPFKEWCALKDSIRARDKTIEELLNVNDNKKSE